MFLICGAFTKTQKRFGFGFMAVVTVLCLDMRVVGDWAGSPVPKCQIFHVFLLNFPDVDLTDI